MTTTILTLFLAAVITSSSLTTTPLNLGMWILMIAFITALFFSFTLSSWFGLLLFLIYIGGMLVMFAYFIAISPNQEIRLGPMLMSSMLLFILLLATTSTSSANILSMSYIIPDFSPLFSKFNISLLLLLGTILFLVLVMVVKVATRMTGPLRPFKYVLPCTQMSPPY